MQWSLLYKAIKAIQVLYVGMVLAAGNAPPPPLPTIDGPESLGLNAPHGAYLVYGRPGGAIVALRLSDLRETVVRAPREGIGWAHSTGGPDRRGRIAYIENHMVEKRHLLRTIMLDGSSDTEIFSRKGDALWEHVIGKDLALTPEGDRVAFLGVLAKKQMHDPKALLQAGPIEVWDLASQQPLDVNVTALDHGLSWFPDGKRLAFVKFVQLDQLPNIAEAASNAQMKFGAWSEIPATFVLDVDTGEETFLHMGWSPVVSMDGAGVIVTDFDWRYLRVSVKSGVGSPIEWPGDWRGPIVLLPDNRLIYEGLPTTGTPVRNTIGNSPLVGPKSMGSIKLADLSTGRFRTLITHIDPRRKLSFGVVADRY